MAVPWRASRTPTHITYLNIRNGAPMRDATMNVLFCSDSTICEYTSPWLRV